MPIKRKKTQLDANTVIVDSQIKITLMGVRLRYYGPSSFWSGLGL
jgi:hypothetical protein